MGLVTMDDPVREEAIEAARKIMLRVTPAAGAMAPKIIDAVEPILTASDRSEIEQLRAALTEIRKAARGRPGLATKQVYRLADAALAGLTSP